MGPGETIPMGLYHSLIPTETSCHLSSAGGQGTGDWMLHHAWKTYIVQLLYLVCSGKLLLRVKSVFKSTFSSNTLSSQ